MKNISSQVHKLWEEIQEAQSNNKNQAGFEIELNKLGYSYNPFSKELIDMNVIKYLSKNEKGTSIDGLKKEDFIKKRQLKFFIKKELCYINTQYKEDWKNGPYAFQDAETQNY